MQVFHSTTREAAHHILASGFRNGKGRYLTIRTRRGVWVSDRPLDANEGAAGDILLTLDIPERVFAEYEWLEQEKTYREALIPAGIVNRCGPVRLVTFEQTPSAVSPGRRAGRRGHSRPSFLLHLPRKRVLGTT